MTIKVRFIHFVCGGGGGGDWRYRQGYVWMVIIKNRVVDGVWVEYCVACCVGWGEIEVVDDGGLVSLVSMLE